MADNTQLNTGTGGDLIATDDIAGVKYQRVKLTLGGDGVNDGDASSGNPVPVAAYGELIEALEAMRYAIQALTRSVGLQTVDAFGRNRVVLDAQGGAQTLGTVTSVGTVTNQAQLGGLAVQDQIPALMHLQADNLRGNITTS
jgi:hypothetical protein